MFTLQVKRIEKESLVVNGSRFLDVELDILDKEEEVIETRRLGFPIDTSEKEVKAELKKFISTYNSDYKQGLVQAKVDKEDKEADRVIKNLSDANIK